MHRSSTQINILIWHQGWPWVQHDRLCPQHVQLPLTTGAIWRSFKAMMYKDNSKNCQEMNLSITITSKIISSNKLKLNDQELNLSFVANLTDAAIHKLLSAPRDSRPGALWSFVYLLLISFCICCWDLLWICSYLFVCVFWVRLWSSIRVDYLCFVVCFFLFGGIRNFWIKHVYDFIHQHLKANRTLL